MKKPSILFVLLFIAFSAKAQLVYEKRTGYIPTPPYSGDIGVLSFNGPSLYDGNYLNILSSYKLYKPVTTWHGMTPYMGPPNRRKFSSIC